MGFVSFALLTMTVPPSLKGKGDGGKGFSVKAYLKSSVPPPLKGEGDRGRG